MPKGAEPPWRVVWNALERTDDEFRNALAKMETQFVSRQFIAPSELLHEFGLRLWLSDLGILDQSRDQLVAEGRRYIDDLYDRKCLEAWSDEAFDQLSFGYGGLGVREADKKDFRELSDYLMERRNDLTERSYPEKGARLLAEMEADSQLSFRRVNITNSEDNIWSRVKLVRVVSHLPGMRCSVNSRRTIGSRRRALNERPCTVAVK